MEEEVTSSALKITKCMKLCRRLYSKSVAQLEMMLHCAEIQGFSRARVSNSPQWLFCTCPVDRRKEDN